MAFVMSLEGPQLAAADKIRASLFAVTPKGVLRAGFTLGDQIEQSLAGPSIGLSPDQAVWARRAIYLAAGLSAVALGFAAYRSATRPRGLGGVRADAARRKQLEAKIQELYRAGSYAGITPEGSAKIQRQIDEVRAELDQIPAPTKRGTKSLGAAKPKDCHELIKAINRARQTSVTAFDNPNRTNSEARAVEAKYRERYEKLEAQAKAQGC